MNRLQNVRIEERALWKDSGVVTFDESHNASEGRIDPAGKLTVQADALDAYFSKWGRPPDVIKMDIEGGEVAAFQGARNMLRAGVRVMFVESFGPNLPSCRSLLENAGYGIEPLIQGLAWENTTEIVVRRGEPSSAH